MNDIQNKLTNFLSCGMKKEEEIDKQKSIDGDFYDVVSSLGLYDEFARNYLFSNKITVSQTSKLLFSKTMLVRGNWIVAKEVIFKAKSSERNVYGSSISIKDFEKYFCRPEQKVGESPPIIVLKEDLPLPSSRELEVE